MAGFHHALDLGSDASIKDIKKAYFEKATAAFDMENSENGKVSFIRAHESFAFLAGKKAGIFYTLKRSAYKQLTTSALADWENKFPKRREQVHKVAETLWQLGREGFIESSFYKETQAIKVEIKESAFLPSIYIAIINPIVLTLLMGLSGLMLAMLVIFLLLPYWQRTFRQKFFVPLSLAQQGLVFLLNARILWTLIFFSMNLAIFFYSSARTFILFKTLAGVFLLVIILGLLIPTRKIKILKNYPARDLGLGFVPFLLNVFFAINLNLSTPLVQESHQIIFDFEYITGENGRGGKWDVKPLIRLEHDLYEKHLHIRQFSNRNIVRDKHTFIMNIHKGLFDIPVLKSWELE